MHSLKNPKLSNALASSFYLGFGDVQILFGDLINHILTPRSYLRQIYGAVYMLGLLIGSTVMGFISDKYGRVTGTF